MIEQIMDLVVAAFSEDDIINALNESINKYKAMSDDDPNKDAHKNALSMWMMCFLGKRANVTDIKKEIDQMKEMKNFYNKLKG